MMNYYYGSRYGSMIHPFYGEIGISGLILNIFFWIVVAFLVVGLIRWFSESERNKDNSDEIDPESDSALDILKKRYAKGDITKKEYDSMKKDIA